MQRILMYLDVPVCFPCNLYLSIEKRFVSFETTGFIVSKWYLFHGRSGVAAMCSLVFKTCSAIKSKGIPHKGGEPQRPPPHFPQKCKDELISPLTVDGQYPHKVQCVQYTHFHVAGHTKQEVIQDVFTLRSVQYSTCPRRARGRMHEKIH